MCGNQRSGAVDEVAFETRILGEDAFEGGAAIDGFDQAGVDRLLRRAEEDIVGTGIDDDIPGLVRRGRELMVGGIEIESAAGEGFVAGDTVGVTAL